VWDDLVLVYFEGEVWKQEIEHLGFKAQYSNMNEMKQNKIWTIAKIWVQKNISYLTAKIHKRSEQKLAYISSILYLRK
jgi:hypothetical protein